MKTFDGSTRGGRGGGRGNNNNNRGGDRGRGGRGAGAGAGAGPRGRGRGGNFQRENNAANSSNADLLDRRFANRAATVQVDRRGRPQQQQHQYHNQPQRGGGAFNISRGGILNLNRGHGRYQQQQQQKYDDEKDDFGEDFFEEGEEDEEGGDNESIYMDSAEMSDLDDEAVQFAEGAEEIETCDATRRLAVVNIDWDNVRPEDLFALFTHTVPVGGSVISVTKYLSDFGAERLEREKKHGPELWVKRGEAGYEEEAKARNKKNAVDSSSAAAGGNEAAATRSAVKGEAAALSSFFKDDADEDDEADVPLAGGEAGGVTTDMVGDDEDVEDGLDQDYYDQAALMADEDDNDELFSSGKHRQYELSRMKYYYCIAEFDSAATAEAVYNLCDGVDIEASGVVLDLRYVPDEEQFDGTRIVTPPGVVTRLPRNYQHLKSFQSAALTNARFKISWDRDDAARSRQLQEAFGDDSEEANLKAYMASSSDDDDNEDATAAKQRRLQKRLELRRKYAALLGDIGVDVNALPNEEGNDNNNHGKDDNDDEDAAAGNKRSKRKEFNKKKGEKNEDAKKKKLFSWAASDSEEDANNANVDGDDDFDDGEEFEEDGDEDDDLNDEVLARFNQENSDEEGEEGEEEDEEVMDAHFDPTDFEGMMDEDEDDDGRFVAMESGMDMDADDKALRLQRNIAAQSSLANATLGDLAKAKYMERRKQQKKDKMNAIMSARANAELPVSSAEKEEQEKELRSALGDAVMAPKDPNAAKGKQRVKDHAKQKRTEEREAKEQLKQRRMMQALGVQPDQAAKQPVANAATSIPSSAVVRDDRFRNRLVNDPRFHVDASGDRQRHGAKQDSARSVAAAIQREREQQKTQQPQQQQQQQPKQKPSQQQSSTSAGDDALRFFENSNSNTNSSGKRRQRE